MTVCGHCKVIAIMEKYEYKLLTSEILRSSVKWGLVGHRKHLVRKIIDAS